MRLTPHELAQCWRALAGRAALLRPFWMLRAMLAGPLESLLLLDRLLFLREQQQMKEEQQKISQQHEQRMHPCQRACCGGAAAAGEGGPIDGDRSSGGHGHKQRPRRLAWSGLVPLFDEAVSPRNVAVVGLFC